MKSGSVVIASMQQADRQWKNRPALLLCRVPPFDDLLLCGITTQLRHQVVDFDETIGENDADFRSSGLATSSLIRLGYLSTVVISDVKGTIGVISPDRLCRLRRRLSVYLNDFGD